MRALHRRAVRYWIVTVGVVAFLIFGAPITGSVWARSMMWGIMPATVAVGIAVLSVYSIVRRFGAIQLLLGTPTILLSVGSLWILKQMFFDRAWPTYLPYLAIAMAIPIAAIQSYLARSK